MPTTIASVSSDPILAQSGFVSGPSDCSGSMERQAKTRAPLRAQRPKDFSVSRLPPRRQQYQRRRTSSYKDFWLIVALQGAKMSIRFGAGERIGRKGREGHPPRDAAAFFGGGQDPHRGGGPARRGKHRGALPSGGDRPESL